MPDRRRHRGKHPDDMRLFAATVHETLRKAVADYSWLLSRDYAEASALKIVGDRYGLTARQRMAVRRSACSDASLQRRAAARTEGDALAGQHLAVDGYNLLITVESALSGGLILIGRDGCYRDLASIHGTYRKVEETVPALTMILNELAARKVERIDWYLDQPVANSGRLKTLIAELVDRGKDSASRPATCNIELVHSPDRALRSYPGIVATSDSVILDECRAWTNLAAEIIDTRVPDAWKIDLRLDCSVS